MLIGTLRRSRFVEFRLEIHGSRDDRMPPCTRDLSPLYVMTEVPRAGVRGSDFFIEEEGEENE